MTLNPNESCEAYDCVDVIFKAGNPALEHTLVQTSFKPARSVPIYEGALNLRVEPGQEEIQWSLRLYLEKRSIEKVKIVAYMTKLDRTRINIEIQLLTSTN